MISCMTRAPGSYRSSAGEMWKREKCFSLDIPFYRTSGPNASESPVNQELCNDVRAYTLRSANQELAPSLRHPASNF